MTETGKSRKEKAAPLAGSWGAVPVPCLLNQIKAEQHLWSLAHSDPGRTRAKPSPPFWRRQGGGGTEGTWAYISPTYQSCDLGKSLELPVA